MSRINFIKPIIVPNKKEIRFWYWLWTVITTIVLITIIITTTTQWYLYRSLKAHKETLEHQLTQYATITAQHQTYLTIQKQFQKQLDRINLYKANPKNPVSILQIIRKVTQGTTIQHGTINTEHFELCLLCQSIAQVTACLQRLQQEPSFANSMLISLESQQEKIQIIIKGDIATQLRDIH